MRAAWLLLLLLPPAHAMGLDNPDDAVATTLYAHLMDTADLPLTTQPPPDDWTHTDRMGLVTPSQGCVDIPGLGLASSTFHTRYAYAHPAPVEYQDGPRPAPVRGIHTDLDVEGPVRFSWFLEQQLVGRPTAGATPEVSVRATLRLGDTLNVDHAAMDTGRVLAQGETGPALLAGPATQGDGVRYVGTTGHDLYAFDIELEALAPNFHIPRETGFNLRIDTFVRVPGCEDPSGGRYVMPEGLRAYTGPGHRPALHWSVHAPVIVRSMATRLVNGTLEVDAEADTPWGPYQLGPMDLWLEHDAGRTRLDAWVRDVVQGHEVVGRRLVWSGPPPEGPAWINLTVEDAAGNAARGSLPFQIGTACHVAADQETLCHTATTKTTPMPAVLVLLAVLVARRSNKP